MKADWNLTLSAIHLTESNPALEFSSQSTHHPEAEYSEDLISSDIKTSWVIFNLDPSAHTEKLVSHLQYPAVIRYKVSQW